eukprot:8990714-Pyramimonas_sp.AAC.1
MGSRSAAEVFGGGGRSVADVFGGRSAADVFGSRASCVPPQPQDYASMKSNPVVFVEIEIDGRVAGQMRFELYGKDCPRTVENFRSLCTGEMGRGQNTVSDDQCSELASYLTVETYNISLWMTTYLYASKG